jgi:predicted nucleic acid-binding protein
VLGRLVTRYELRGNLVSDAAIAALAIEHGLTVCSSDTDFARFEEIRWLDPLAS